MPYVEQKNRDCLDPLILELAKEIETDGELNYVVTVLAHLRVMQKGLGYQSLQDVSSVLDCARQEFYRRVISRYEDIKIKQNGDVETDLTKLLGELEDG